MTLIRGDDRCPLRECRCRTALATAARRVVCSLRAWPRRPMQRNVLLAACTQMKFEIAGSGRGAAVNTGSDCCTVGICESLSRCKEKAIHNTVLSVVRRHHPPFPSHDATYRCPRAARKLKRQTREVYGTYDTSWPCAAAVWAAL